LLELSGTEIRKHPFVQRKELFADFLAKVKDGISSSTIISRGSPGTLCLITRASSGTTVLSQSEKISLPRAGAVDAASRSKMPTALR
jgi:hypothetical protein